jgi:hypothetical protein
VTFFFRAAIGFDSQILPPLLRLAAFCMSPERHSAGTDLYWNVYETVDCKGSIYDFRARMSEKAGDGTISAHSWWGA